MWWSSPDPSQRWLWLALCLAVSAGCGFHLRGSGQTPLSLQELYVEGDASEQFIHELGISLVRAGGTLAGRRGEARYIVNLKGEHTAKDVLTVSAAGQVLEYELHYAVTFEVMDKTGRRLMPPQQVSALRDVTFNPATALGKANEEQQLYGHLHREVISQIIRRMNSALSRK